MDTAKLNSRSLLRTAAMQLIYEHFSGGEGGDDTLAMICEELQEENGQEVSITRKRDREYIDRAVAGVTACQQELDEKIASAARGWSIDRIGKVDLCILRLALWEIYNSPDVPDNVSVAEAVALAKRYSDENSGRFVNGVLGTLVREKEEQEEKQAEQKDTEKAE